MEIVFLSAAVFAVFLLCLRLFAVHMAERSVKNLAGLAEEMIARGTPQVRRLGATIKNAICDSEAEFPDLGSLSRR